MGGAVEVINLVKVWGWREGGGGGKVEKTKERCEVLGGKECRGEWEEKERTGEER